MKGKRVLPPTYLFAAIVAMGVLYLVFPLAQVIHFPWILLGLLPLAVGIVVNIIASGAFDKAGTTVKPFEESSVLITGGVFRASRHPMYLGFVLVLAGIAVLTGVLTPYFVVPVFAILMHVVFIRVEERMLEEKFGQEWLDYKKKVRCWI